MLNYIDNTQDIYIYMYILYYLQFNIILFHIYFLVQIQLIKPSTGRRGKAKGTTRDDEAEKRDREE